MKTALLLSQESKCVSKKVGAIIVKEGRIISIGYNGTPAGYENCSDHFNSDFDREAHHEWSNSHEIHAEMSCLLYAAKNGISIDNSVIYVTLQPCQHCLKNLIQSGITRIYYLFSYDKAGAVFGDKTKRILSDEIENFIKKNDFKNLV